MQWACPAAHASGLRLNEDFSAAPGIDVRRHWLIQQRHIVCSKKDVSNEGASSCVGPGCSPVVR